MVALPVVVAVLSVVAVFATCVWLAVALLMLRDRIRGDQPVSLLESEGEEPAIDTDSQPGWKRMVAVPLGLVLGPVVIAVVVVLVMPLLVLQFGFAAYCWLRFRLVGIPMPPFGPPEDA